MNHNTTCEPVIVERILEAPTNRVWDALTTPDALRQWSFEVDTFEAKVGCEFRFTVEKDGVVYPHVCIVTEVVDQKRLAYTWRYDGYEGETLVRFDLEPMGDKTRLTVTHFGLETLPPMARFAKENFVRGWTNLLGSLKEFTETED